MRTKRLPLFSSFTRLSDTLHAYCRDFTLWSAVRLLVSYRFNRLTGLLNGRSITIYTRRNHIPFELRWGTSDYQVFREVFRSDEYSVLPDNEEFQSVLDVGANVGVMTLFLWLRHGAKRIAAIEAERHNFEALQRNARSISRYGGIDVKAYHCAVWETSGVVALATGNKTQSTFCVTASPAGPHSTQEVAAITLNESIGLIGDGALDLIKVDIEDAEANVFLGEHISRLNDVRAMLVELHSDRSRATVRRAADCHGLRLSRHHTLNRDSRLTIEFYAREAD